MITPRQTRLIRVPDLHAFRALATHLATGEGRGSRVVLVPTGGAARQFRLTVERLTGRPLAASVDLLTREEWYESLASRLSDPPRRLTPFERDSLAQAAAAEAAAEVPGLSFQLRPGLIAEILRFYDQLRRQGQQVQRFEALIDQALAPSAIAGDRGAERMRLQTRFLATTFRGYEARVADQGACDEHGLRARLTDAVLDPPLAHAVITVADWIADPAGLYLADFDLLSRVAGLERIDVVATEATLASGFHERIRDWLPGLDEAHADAILGPFTPVRPALVTPTADADRLWFTVRDRAEELVAVARRIKAGRRRGRAVPLDRMAIVYKNPLPYLYLAPETIGAANIAYQTFDALPLAGEPTAAAVDLVLEFVETAFTRTATVALLRSPHFALGADTAVTREGIAELDRALSRARYLGELGRLEGLADEWRNPAAHSGQRAAVPALEAALAVARELAALIEPATASQQLGRVRRWLVTRFRPLADDDPFAVRESRARTAILDLLDRLIEAHAAHHDPAWTIEDLAAAVRRWIADQTFTPDTAATGLHLLNDQAARYGTFDDVAIVGLVETEWPERSRRNIFYPTTLLKALGWPSERDRRSAEDTRLRDLVSSASERVALSTFTLDDESLVARSVQLDDVARARLTTLPDEPDGARVFADEVLAADATSFDGLPEAVRPWAALRHSRPPADAPGYHGVVGPRPPRAWSVSALETYLDCPFKFFAQHVLTLEEEPDDEEVMDPRRQGLFVHNVFERFFAEWQRAGHGAVTPANLDDARGVFADVVERELVRVPEAEAGLERTRLLGSSAAAGLGEAVLRMEAERPVPVVERLLEHRLDGALVVSTPDGPRPVTLRGKADRIDLLADGSFRLIDYKLGWPPQRGRALQLPIYGLSAEQRLAGHRGRTWTLGEAVYLAFKGSKRVVPLFSPADRDRVLADAQARLAGVLDAIERGEFPPTPDDIFRCETCSFFAVCRKDYVGDTA